MSASVMAPETTLLACQGLHAGYGEMAVVRDLDLHVGPGEVVALLGPNGAGKTTTLLTLAGDLPPLAGTVSWEGVPTKAPLHRRARNGLAFVSEEKSVVMGLSVRDNLRLGGADERVALEW